MSEHARCQERGTFSCKIDGRAGYLRLWDDRLELIRSGRGPQAFGPEVIPMHLITRVSTAKVGRLLTVVELVAAGGYVELKLPSIDAPRVADLISLLAAAAPVAPEPVAPEPVAPEPVALPEPTEPTFSVPEPTFPPLLAVIPSQVAEAVFAEPVLHQPAFAEAAGVEPVPADVGIARLSLPDFVIPDFSMKVEMPQWTPLAEDGEDEAAPVDPAAPVADGAVLAEIEPRPDESVLAAAAALAELEDMLCQIPPAPVGGDVESDAPSVPSQSSEAVLTPAAGSVLEGTGPDAADAEPATRPERPAELPPELERRLSRLEVLRNSGIMTESDFAGAEAEILAAAWETVQSA